MLSIFRSRKLILASRSPRRRDLLESIGLTFDIAHADVDETIDMGKPLQEELCRVARSKAEAVAAQQSGIVLGADTIVVHDGRIMTKPGSQDEARQFLTTLSDTWHEVYTGYTLVDTESECEVTRCIGTSVRFFGLSDEVVDWYLSTGEYGDKAGGYAIQGFGKVLVREIRGSYTNVVGLPVEYVVRDLMAMPGSG